MKKYLLLLPLACGIIYTGCKKSNNTASFTTDAKIVYTGSPASDGCGYLVLLDTLKKITSSALPHNLDAAYQVDELKVRITYHVVTARGYSCSRAFVPNDPNNMDIIAIDAISRR